MSLIGIIFVQGYWISNSVKNKAEQFELNVKRVLVDVVNELQKKEFEELYYPFQSIIDSTGIPDDLTFNEILLIEDDSINNEQYIYRNGILQQDFKLSAPSLDFDLDSTQFFSRFYRRKVRQVLDKSTFSGDIGRPTSTNRSEEFYRLDDYEKNNFKEIVKERARKIPIHQRVKVEDIKRLMTLSLVELGLETDYEFGIYSNNLATRVRSENFVLDRAYGSPLFEDDQSNSNYVLYASFPGEKKFVISSVLGLSLIHI